ncbi:hypothetical protein [Methanimicrococcus hacksteinii]|uniref:hypothetical protein n=1 Tax=Methanimicrococcus hacksteinii TaxID=3028293 RepID=UPI00298F28AA|nr:hypothetical protein [Methanimicrococcus sp. At1]
MHHLIFITSVRYANGGTDYLFVSVCTATFRFPFARLPSVFRLHGYLPFSVCTATFRFPFARLPSVCCRCRRTAVTALPPCARAASIKKGLKS